VAKIEKAASSTITVLPEGQELNVLEAIQKGLMELKPEEMGSGFLVIFRKNPVKGEPAALVRVAGLACEEFAALSEIIDIVHEDFHVAFEPPTATDRIN
jgi:hypothetical protein